MKKYLFLCLTAIFICASIGVNQSFAYSYGDPNEEKLAEVYKEMMIKLDESPPNFASAKALYETVQEEVDMHMGPEPSEVILNDLEEENKEGVTENMEKLLVLNIARRLEGIEQNFNEYDTSKKLLAKGFATYEALSPKIEAEHPETDNKLRAEFDAALNALGNPGLFGVGKKESDIEAFKSSKETILATLQEEYNIESLEVGHFTESENNTETASGKKDWTDLSNLRNWIPLVLIVAIIAGVTGFTLRKRKLK
ncbi:hypothetical protein CVD25_20220 [Bacillus canaveralius]|uniref:Extracellular protein n=1 Tax=Bacillus canaveralius TaxID=1403243 RepID=A0A2N5GFU7_9BACI|nr:MULTISPECIES: hypothetical protein [Bacillus]PLR79601.1 hypothetical protein CU635_22315 [Bacillus canaveralius]PLR83081.1 hypothetical protein CVD23_15295 [Bacillus sp. V33-4]PLR90093.1 hypothetical protein CVD25_20220 [Bacillus canaveralius]RSK52502.1 hypothetical protein EJA13_11210 [Bacillus canaveralius]